MEGYRIQGSILGWILQLKGHRSGWTKVRRDVPQVSALGPLLFTIFIDDIYENVLCEISKFGDNKNS